jgi:hypothetical protein
VEEVNAQTFNSTTATTQFNPTKITVGPPIDVNTGQTVAVPGSVKVYTDPITGQETVIEDKPSTPDIEGWSIVSTESANLDSGLGLGHSSALPDFGMGDCKNPNYSEILNNTNEVIDLCDYTGYSIVAINGKTDNSSYCDEDCLKRIAANVWLFQDNRDKLFTSLGLSSLYKFVKISNNYPVTFMDVIVGAPSADGKIYKQSPQCYNNLEPNKLYKCTITIDTNEMKMKDMNMTNTNN